MTTENKDKLIVMEDEKHLLMNHDYDGIQELDHPLPSWWLACFWGGIIYAFGYCAFYWLGPGQTIDQTFEQEYAVVMQAKEAAKKKQGGFDIAAYNEAKAIAATEGKTSYTMNCSACHGAEGQGGIGPNLTDKFWVHGNGSAESVFKVVKDGVLAKGMPAWASILNKKQMLAVTAYIEGLKGTNPEGAKGPQGEAFE